VRTALPTANHTQLQAAIPASSTQSFGVSRGIVSLSRDVEGTRSATCMPDRFVRPGQHPLRCASTGCAGRRSHPAAPHRVGAAPRRSRWDGPPHARVQPALLLDFDVTTAHGMSRADCSVVFFDDADGLTSTNSWNIWTNFGHDCLYRARRGIEQVPGPLLALPRGQRVSNEPDGPEKGSIAAPRTPCPDRRLARPRGAVVSWTCDGRVGGSGAYVLKSRRRSARDLQGKCEYGAKTKER